MRILGINPFFKRQTALKQQLNNEKWNVGYISACGRGVFVSSIIMKECWHDNDV